MTGWADHAGPIHLRGKLVIDTEHCTPDRLSYGYYDHLDMENDPIPQSRTGPPCSLLVMSEAEASALLLRIDRPARRSRRIVRLFSMSKWYNIWQIAAFYSPCCDADGHVPDHPGKVICGVKEQGKSDRDRTAQRHSDISQWIGVWFVFMIWEVVGIGMGFDSRLTRLNWGSSCNCYLAKTKQTRP